jgi:hypothetical protein
MNRRRWLAVAAAAGCVCSLIPCPAAAWLRPLFFRTNFDDAPVPRLMNFSTLLFSPFDDFPFLRGYNLPHNPSQQSQRIAPRRAGIASPAATQCFFGRLLPRGDLTLTISIFSCTAVFGV